MSPERERASRRESRDSRDFVQQEMDNLKQFKRLSIGQLSSVQDPDLPTAQPLQTKSYEKKDNTLWVPASVHPEVSPNEWKSFVSSRIKRDSTGSRLSQIISDETDLKDASAVLERKRQSQDLSNRRHSILELSAFEFQQFDMEKPVVKEAGVELRRSGASSRRKRPVLRNRQELERRASETAQRVDKVDLGRNKSLPSTHKENGDIKPLPQPHHHRQERPPQHHRVVSPSPSPPASSHEAPLQASIPLAQQEIQQPKVQPPPPPKQNLTISIPNESWHLEEKAQVRPEKSLPTIPPEEEDRDERDDRNEKENKSFWRWRKGDTTKNETQPVTSPTSKTFTSLFKRKKERTEPTTPTDAAAPVPAEPLSPEPQPLPSTNGIPLPKKSSHQRSNSQTVSKHEIAELKTKIEQRQSPEPAEQPESEPEETPHESPKSQNSKDIQLPYAIPAHQVSDRSYVMMYHRFPLHIERAIYRFSHMKLANPRRPLREQVLLSNFMYAYLNLINQGYQQQMEQQALGEHPNDPNDPNEDRQGEPHIEPRGTSRRSRAAAIQGEGEEHEAREADYDYEGGNYGYQDYDFEFYQQQQDDSSSSSSSESELEEMWEARQ